MQTVKGCRGVPDSQGAAERCRQSRGAERLSLTVLGYHWLPLATIDLVGDNREFEV